MAHADAAAGTGAGRPATEPKETRRRENSRRRLVEAARDAFAERGIRDTPVELICERAGFTRGAFYSNFTSKEDLFLAVYEEETAGRRRLFAQSVASAIDLPAADDLPSLREAVADMVRWYVTTYAGDETWFVLMSEFRLQALRQPDLRPRLEAVNRTTVDELTAVVEAFVSRAGLRLAVDARYAVRAVLALYEDTLAQNLLAGRPLAADSAFLTEVMPRLLSGLLE